MYPEHYRESSETRPSKIKVNSFVILGRPVSGLLYIAVVGSHITTSPQSQLKQIKTFYSGTGKIHLGEENFKKNSKLPPPHRARQC